MEYDRLDSPSCLTGFVDTRLNTLGHIVHRNTTPNDRGSAAARPSGALKAAERALGCNRRLAAILIQHQATLTFRLEVINLFNSRDLAGPVIQFPQATFGQITASGGVPRTLQPMVRAAF